METSVKFMLRPEANEGETVTFSSVPEAYEGDEVEVATGDEGRFVAGRSRAADTVCLEPGCEFRCSRIPRLREHLSSAHGIPQPMQMIHFSTEEDFREWMSRIESENHCSYMRRRGWQRNKNSSRTACYYCHRGGVYISNASRKQSKQQGTCKTGVECTSSLKVTMWSPPLHKNLIEVEAYLKHYGHNFELGHTRIHWHDRKQIEEKLKNGISRHKILDEIRGSLDQSSDLSRIHLVSLQDIYNIEKRCGIKANRGRYCSEAGITAQAWIEAMQQSEENPVLLIKYQQEAAPEKHKCLGDDDFLLILQTPLQKKMLQKHGPRQFMCIDITQGSATNDQGGVKGGHEFQLFALEVLIPDENQSKGPYPVAWCVSNRKDGEIVTVFFNCIKENLSGFTLTPGFMFIPSAGVTNGHDWFNIWCETFGAGPRKLISSWHVLEEWRHNLQLTAPAVYASTSERSRVLGNLETVIRESSVDHFGKLIDECVADLKTNAMTSLFASYFENNYMSQAELWASAYRTDAANSADMHLDAFHARLSKHIYQEALKRKQLDILVKTLMKYTRDNVLPKLRTLHKGKNEFHQRTVTAATHRQSLDLSLENVTLKEGCKDEWGVMSAVEVADGKISKTETIAVQYTVKVHKDQSCTARLRCPLRCVDCGTCPHQIMCTCCNSSQADDSIAAADRHMCIHAHQVCRYMLEKHKIKMDSFLNTSTVLTSEERDDVSPSAREQKMVECAPVTDVIITLDTENPSPDVTNDLHELTRGQEKPVLPVCSSETKRKCKSANAEPLEVKPKKIIKLKDLSGILFVPSSVPAKIVITKKR